MMPDKTLDRGVMQDFWDLDFAHRCVQGGLPYVRGLRKPEAVAALRALVGFVQLLPQAAALLQEIRALAGRRVDGLDKADGPDHVRQALQDQRGLRPYTYTAALRASGVPQAPPPRLGQQPAHSFVPGDSLPRTSLQRLAGARRRQEQEEEEAAAAAADLLADSQDLRTQNRGVQAAQTVGATPQKESQDHGTQDEGDSMLFSGLGTLTGLASAPGSNGELDDAVGGADEEDGSERKVSDLDEASNPFLCNVDVPGTLPHRGGGARAVPQLGGGFGTHVGAPLALPQVGGGVVVHAPAETGPLVADGVTVGRNEVDQSQGQDGAQAQGISAAERKRPQRRAVCVAIRRGDFCVDKDCPKEHPARCGDPGCFPTWRRDCPLWHVRSSPTQAQGNGASAGPGRAGRPQPQGAGQQGQREGRRRQGRQQQRRRQQEPVQQRPRRHQHGWQPQQQQPPPLSPSSHHGGWAGSSSTKGGNRDSSSTRGCGSSRGSLRCSPHPLPLPHCIGSNKAWALIPGEAQDLPSGTSSSGAPQGSTCVPRIPSSQDWRRWRRD